MRVKCLDGYVREFIPATSIGDHLPIHQGNIKVAQCYHCKENFNIKPTNEQKEIWRIHICDTKLLRKWKLET